MTEPLRLAKRVVALTGCSRREAELYIEGGWVRVDGQIVEKPHFMVDTQDVRIDPAAKPVATEPATVMLHKPAGVEIEDDARALHTLIAPPSRWAGDASGVRPMQRHLQRLSAPLGMPARASGLLILTQDARVLRKLDENSAGIEQEYEVEVRGTLVPYGLALLKHGLRINNYALPPIKVSWQSEQRLRFAFKVLHAGQLETMCQMVGLEVVSMRCLRVGRLSLAKLPPGQWRYLASNERI